MAVGTGFGLDLSQLDAAIKNADEALKSLAKTGERTSKQINEAFSLAKNGNIQDFISVIERLSNTLGKKGYNQAAQMVREIATETTSAIDRVSRFATLMQTISDGGRSNVKNGAIENLKYQLDEALSRLGVLNERLQFYTKGEGAKAVNANVVDTSALQDEANKLRVVVELLQRRLESEQALAALKQRSGAIENQQALNTSWQKMEEERTKQLQQQSINAKEANKAYEQAYNDRYQMYAVMYDKMWQEDLKHFERQNANAKSGGQQYAKEYEERTRFYEKWINESYALEEEKAARAKKLEEERVALELDKKRKLSEMAQAEENARYNKWLENNDKEYTQKEAKERELFNKTIERIGKQSAEFQKAEDARYQRWLELKDKEKQREQADESAKFQRQKNTIYQQNARFAAEELRIRRQLSEETIDAVVSEAKKRIEVERLVRAEQKKAHDQRQRELEELFREQERQAKAQAQYDSKARKEKYKSYTTSYEGAIRTSDKANTLAKETQAVKNLEAARAKLSKTDADYHKKLGELNTRIKQHNQNIERATEGTKKLNGALATIGRGIASAFSVQAIRGYVNQMIKVRGEMELQQKSLQAILQNKDAANEIWQKTIDLAVRSPFRIKELVTYTKQLAAYRVEADKLYETNKMLADVSAGLGVDMQRLILAFGQVKAANFLRGTELRQFTEAGIPMLDELAKHFNDMNNTALTSADVFEMISKRMVLFEDVEAVFERLTKAGGTFYRMQEIQAETLRGQISNLKDSIDIMLNDMGKANDSTMKFAVKSVKMLVDNYERLVPILKTVISAMAVYKLNAFLAARQTGILTSMLFNMGVAAEKFFLTISKNPWTAITAVILAAAGAVYRYIKALNDVDKAYSDMYRQQSEITSKFFKAKDIDERKRALKDLVEYANKEYSIEVDLDFKGMSDDEVRTEMNRLRQQMIKANAFGATFQKELIKANQETSMGQWWDLINPLIGQGMNKDIDQMGDSYKNLNDLLMNNLSPTIDYLSTQLGKLNKDQRDALESLKAGIGEWKDKDEDMVDYFKRIRGNYETLIGLLSESDNIADKKIARQLKKYQRRYDEAEKEFQTFIDRIDDDIAKLNAEDKAIFLSAAIDDAKSEKNWSEFEETQIRKWLEKKYKIELTPKIVEEDKELKAWQDSYNKLFEGKTGWSKIRTKGTSQTQVIEQLNAQYKATEELVKRIQQAGEDSILEGGAYEGENLEKLKKDLADIQEQLNWFGAEAKKDKNKESASIKILQKRINLLKEVNKKYLELEKTFDAVTAKEKVMEAYSDTFREAFAGTGVELDMYKVMTQVIADSKKVGEEMGTNLSEGVINKLKELEGAGTYIRSATEDVVEFTKAQEAFRPNAYLDKMANVWTIGYGTTSKAGIGVNVVKGMVIDQAKAEEWLLKTYKSKEQILNSILDKHKDLIITQEQYNALLDAAYNGEGAAKAIEFAYGSWEHFERYLHSLKAMKQANKKAVVVDVEEIKKEWEALDTIQEKLALTLKWSGIRTGGKVSSALQDRAIKRAEMYSGDLDIAKQLESVLVRIAGMDFTTTEGMVEALGKLKEIAEKEGPEAQKILSQVISGFEVEIGLRLEKDSQKKIQEQIDEFFDQYDLSVELKKLNIPPKIAKELFNVDVLNIGTLRKKVIEQFAGGSEEIKAELEKGVLGANWEKIHELGFGKDQIEKVKQYLEKVDDLEKKYEVERMKTYSKYLMEGMSERVKLKIEELRKLKEVEASKGFSDAQKTRIKAGISKEARAEQQAQEWKDFQGSEMYTMMFEDLEFLGTKALDVLKEKLEELKVSLKDLPASEVKEIIGQISKIEDITIQRNPFASLRDAMKEVRELEAKGRTEEVLQEEFAAAELKRQSYQEELDAVNLVLSANAKELNLAMENAEWAEKYGHLLGMQTSELERQSLILSTLATGQGMVASNAAKDLKAYADARKALSAVSNEWGTIKSLAEKAYGSVKEVLESMGVESDSVAMSLADSAMNMVDLVFQAVMFDMQLKVMTAQAQLLGVAMNTALGPIGWIVLALQAVATLLSAILGARDKALQKQVEDNLAAVERLQKAYEDIEESIDNAWDTASIQAYNQELKATTQSMIDAQKAAIAAQSKRKGANKEGSDAYNELQEMKAELAELEAQLGESLANSFSKVTDGILDSVHDAAREFTDAWWDAFVETGDGLSGLEENFNEMFLNLAKNQAAMQITGAFADRWKKDLEKYINADDTELTKDEAKKWAEEVRRTMPELSAALEGYLGAFKDMAPAEGAGLSGLQKGIQGITEDTAQIIEAYLNSIRGYVSEQVTHTKNIYRILYDAVHSDAAAIRVRMV